MQFDYSDTSTGIAALKRESRETNYSMQGYIEQSLDLFLKNGSKWMQNSAFADKTAQLAVKLKDKVDAEWQLLLSELKAIGYQRLGSVLIRYMLVYAVINQADYDFCGTAKNSKQEIGKVLENTKFYRCNVSNTVSSDVKELCSSSKVSVNQLVNYLVYVLTQNKTMLLQLLSSKTDDENVAALMLTFCNTVFGLQSTESLDDCNTSYIICSIDKGKLDKLTALSLQAHMTKRKMMRCIIHYCISNHKVKSMTEKLTEKKTEQILQSVPESDEVIRLSVRVPKNLRERFQGYCAKKNLTAATLAKLFVKNIANKSFLEEVMKSFEDDKPDANMSLYIRTSDLDTMKSVATIMGTSYSKLFRCFMNYCLKDGFDWTRLEIGNGT